MQNSEYQATLVESPSPTKCAKLWIYVVYSPKIEPRASRFFFLQRIFFTTKIFEKKNQKIRHFRIYLFFPLQ